MENSLTLSQGQQTFLCTHLNNSLPKLRGIFFFYNPNLFAICTKYNKQMGGNRNKRGGRELSSTHPYGGGARPGCDGDILQTKP
jgi:hypothetical protein